MVLQSRRAIASLRRASNRPCGLLVPSANLPPRPIYFTHIFYKSQSRCYSTPSTNKNTVDSPVAPALSHFDISKEKPNWPTPSGENGWVLVAQARCFGCGMEGHQIKDCPVGDNKSVNWKDKKFQIDQSADKPFWETASGENGWKLVAEGKCFNCGETGHRHRKCPKKKDEDPKEGESSVAKPEIRTSKPATPKVSYAETMRKKHQDIQEAREVLGLKPDEEVIPTVEEALSWPKDYEDDVYDAGEFNKLPREARKALRAPIWWRKDPITADNLMKSIDLDESELERIAHGGKLKRDVRKKKHGAVEPLKKSDVDPEDLKDIADLRELNTLIRDERFTEAELRDIMEDDSEPENDILLWREMLEETQRDMRDDERRLSRHENEVLQAEIKKRVEEGMDPEKAEHDARAIMRLPQKRTAERIELTRDLSNEALEITETMSNRDLRAMREKGRRGLMKRLEQEHEYLSQPLKPSDEEGYDMYPISAPGQEGEDDADPKIWDWNSTDLSTIAHSELQEHREARKYARLAIYDMPRLIQYAKPFEIPNSKQVLRFRYTTYMGASHPSESKVVMECCPADLGIKDIELRKLIKICGPRYNPEKKTLKFSCEMFQHQHQNKRYLSELMDKLVDEAKDKTDTFEDVPFDFRHHEFEPKRKFPKEWLMSKRKLELKRLQDWEKLASPAEIGQLQTYVDGRFQKQQQPERQPQLVAVS